MGGLCQAAGELAPHLHPHEPVEQGGRPGPDLCAAATGANHPTQNRGGLSGQHHREGASRWHRGFKKTARKPSANPAAAAPPKIIVLPQKLAAPSASACPR